jgi:hypothetical protein
MESHCKAMIDIVRFANRSLRSHGVNVLHHSSFILSLCIAMHPGSRCRGAAAPDAFWAFVAMCAAAPVGIHRQTHAVGSPCVAGGRSSKESECVRHAMAAVAPLQSLVCTAQPRFPMVILSREIRDRGSGHCEATPALTGCPRQRGCGHGFHTSYFILHHPTMV